MLYNKCMRTLDFEPAGPGLNPVKVIGGDRKSMRLSLLLCLIEKKHPAMLPALLGILRPLRRGINCSGLKSLRVCELFQFFFYSVCILQRNHECDIHDFLYNRLPGTGGIAWVVSSHTYIVCYALVLAVFQNGKLFVFE